MRFLKRVLVGPTTEELRSYAKDLREGAEQYGLDHHFPVILNELEDCAACGRQTFVLMEPYGICGECWHAIAERDLAKIRNEAGI